MELKDIDAVHSLLQRYLDKFDMAPKFDKEEIDHWMLHKKSGGEQVVWAYVVEVLTKLDVGRYNANFFRTRPLKRLPTSSHSTVSNLLS